MHDLTRGDRAVPGIRAAIVVAIAGSALAGVIHLVAAREHQADSTLFWMFIACAIAQLAWAVAVAKRPTKWVLLTGIVINGGAFYVWFFSRTTGIPFIGALRTAEPVETQDLACALYAVASAVSAGVVLARPVPKSVLPLRWSALAGAAALVLALPAIAAGHTHPADHVHVVAGAADPSHVHIAGGSQATASTDPHSPDGTAAASVASGAAAPVLDASSSDGLAAHSHDSGGVAPSSPTSQAGIDNGAAVGGDPSTGGTPDTAAAHDHAAATPTTASGAPPGTPTGPIISVDDPRLTPAQQAAARALIASTTAAMQAFPDVASVVQAGYVSIGDGDANGYEHYVRWSYLTDPYEVDPNHIESILVQHQPDGSTKVVSAMYILSLGTTMADVPDIAGPLTTWHYHNDLCWSSAMTVVGTAVNGVCAQGTLWVTPPMMHVWMVDNPCGPFAGIDSHGGTCTGH
jgi:hypothetical protein